MSSFTNEENDAVRQVKNTLKSLIIARDLLSPGLLKNIVIAGGFFTSALQSRKFKDIDIFVLDNDVSVYNLLTQGFNVQEAKNSIKNNVMASPSVFDDIDFNRTPETNWSRSEMMAYMHNPNIVDVINNHKTEAQYILTKYKTREELLNHFDYKHCKVSYVPLEDKLYINRETYDCIAKKILKVNNEQPAQQNQKYRLTNFLNKGWVLETPVEQGLNVLTTDQIKDSYEKLKEQAIAAAFGLPPMQQQKSYLDEILDAVTNPSK